MKVKDFTEINPSPSSPIEKRQFIDYIDTAAVTEGRLRDIQHLVGLFPSRAQREVHANDILISSVRPNLKHNYFVKQDEDGMIASSGFVHIRVKEFEKVVPRFLYYFLTNPSKIRYYTRIADCSQSAYPSFNKDVIENIEMPSIPRPTQLLIAGILGSLDEKIEVNRQKITELKALAKAIYDYWFVQYDFPDADGTPYKSSGGAMEWKEELKREVPRGWDVVTLFSIAEIVMGQSPPGKTLNEDGRGTLFFQGSSDFGDVSPSARTFTTEPKRMARQGDILLSVRAPVGATNLALSSCCIGRGLAALRGRKCSNIFIQQTLKTVESRFAAKNVDGTTFGSLSRDELRGILLAKPSSDILRAFDEIVSPIGEAIQTSVLEIRELTKQRDMLLPLLMNGQVNVAG